ncbi:hypothetical protein AWC18_10680 [Mycolicibacter nonchromogenicus]|uniref:Bacteriophage T5 Orf172 DNA-binding domain-containing protein n=1 Tax=Mycolicibacter nonchromogenicus TaxID=1782 RepID=A0A1X1ZB70_MYCNO|nr:GIY-YIG nuclease family protein [Mycolicibacter nonchromogenicus]OBI08458.1 hypothetical protein A5715_15265 [Mycolicibacter heraklionensis]ORW20572.1 hypothetical protein AWC18_10680 [Mycolicibacter nonchromogenicus]
MNQYHLSNGGAEGVQPLDRIAKRALNQLNKSGQVESVDGGFGMWRIGGAQTIQTAPHSPQSAPAIAPNTLDPVPATGAAYEYAGIALTPRLFAKLAEMLFDGQMVKRKTIADTVMEHHLSRGGIGPTMDPLTVCKQGLKLLARDGLVESVEGGFGMWRFAADGIGQPVPLDATPPQGVTPDPSADTNYENAGITLTPSLAGRLAMQLFGGQMVRRNTIIDGVMQYHLSRGGLPPLMEPKDAVRTGLSDLRRDGLIESVEGGYGLWRFPDSGESIRIAFDKHAAAEVESSPDSAADYIHSDGEDPPEDESTAELHYVYVYDLPTYAQLADATGKSHWPHKVGFTRLTPEARISAQVGTALPEHPRLVLSVKHPNALRLERAVHAVLDLRGRKIDGPGAEWFMTNPTEIKALVDMLLHSEVLES